MRFLRKRGGFLVSLAALAVLLWFTPDLWLRLDGWVQNQRDKVWEQVEAVLGQKVVYDRIAPNVLAALDFQNVRLVADNGETLFQAASVRLSWDWEYLLQGRFDQALRRVQVINATLSLDSRRDKALLDRWAGFFRPTSAGGGTSFGFQVEGFNVTARWTDGNQTLALDRGFAVLSPQGKEWGLKYRGSLAWDEKKTSRYARLAVRGELRSDASFRNFSLRTEASSVRTTWFDLEPLTLQVSVDPELLTVAKVADRTPFDLQLAWNRTTDEWVFKGAAERFRPSRLVKIKGARPWSGLADGTVTGKFSYRLGGDFSFAGQASWPAGSVPSPLNQVPVSVRGAVSSQGGVFRFEDFHLETPRVKAGFNGTLSTDFLPDGDLALDRWEVPPWGEAQGQIHLTRSGRRVSFSGADWTWNTLGTASPSGWFEKTAAGWAFSIQGPLDTTEAASFSASGSYLTEPAHLDTEVEVIALPLSLLRTEARGLVPGFDLPPDLWALETTVKARVEWGAGGTPAVSVTSFAFHDPLVADRAGSGTASWRGRHLDLALNPASWDAVRIGGTLSADLEEGGVVAGRLTGWLWNHPFDLSGRWVPSDKTLAFSGKPGVTGVVHQNDAGGWSTHLELDPQELVPGWTVGFLGDATLDGDLWTVSAERLTVAGRYPWNQEAFSLKTKASASPEFVRFDDLVVNDSHGSWSGSAVTSWSLGFSQPWAGRLAVAATGREALTLDWVGSAVDRWHLNLKASGIDLARVGSLVPPELVGRASVAGTADWAGDDGTWSCQASLSEARYGDSPLGFRAALSGTSRKLSVRALNLSVSPLRIVDGSGDLDLDAKTWKAALGVGLRVGAGDWESRWTATGGWTSPGPLQISVALAGRANTWSQRSFPDWAMTAVWGQTSWKAALDDGGLVAEGEAGGHFHVQAQRPFPVVGEAEGTWSQGEFQLGVQGFQADLGLIKDLVNSPLFSVKSGVAQGDFTVGGSLSDPEVTGLVELKNLSLTSSFLRQPVGPVDVPLLLEGHRVRIDPIDIGPGAQTWMVSGAARLDHLLPEEYQLSLQTDALSIIPVSYQYTGISAVGGVSGLLVVKGSPTAVTLGGRLILQDTVITLKPTTPGAASGESLGFNADLSLVTGRKVEFLWPNESLPLLRAVTASGQTLVVKANDVASTWSVVGKLGLRTGEINYLNRTFVLKEGQMTFQEDQAGFDPRISVRAEWKIRETSGPVVINLRADGTLTRFSPRFDAVPYKSPDDLQQLVGTTLALPTDYTKATNVETALSVATDVGTSFLLTPFEETIKKNFQLDLFTVKTEILKKTFLNRNGPQEASAYLDNTRLFFGKYIGDDLFLQGTLAFRQDGSVATQVSPKMVVEPEFQMEFQTPFFLLNWTLLPQHPETLFVTDNTVTFRWNWSY